MPGSDRNEEGLRALGRAVEAAGPNARRRHSEPAHAVPSRRRRTSAATSTSPSTAPGPRRRRWLKRTVIVVVAVVVLAVGAGAGYTWYLNHKIHRIQVKGLSAGTTSGVDAGTENILMVGSTTRCGLAKQTPAYGLCTEGVTGVNSDVVMIMHLDPANKTVSILSIPRDLFIPNARSTGAYKIDAALAQGPTQLVAAIEEDFGIPIQHYVELNFDTFAAVVTALGGITMEFPVPVFDRESGLNVLVTGCHHLDGVEALQVVRARHLQYYQAGDTPTTPSTWTQEAESDLARIRRDHEFLRVLATKMAKQGLGDPTTDLSIVDSVASDLTVDSGLSLSDMVSLVLDFHSVDIDKAPQLTLPVLVGRFGTYHYEGGSFGDVEFPTEPLDQSVVDQFLAVGTDTSTMTGDPLPSPGSVSVSVLDGTDVTGQATQTATSLGDLGFDVVGTGSTTPVAQESETLVTYSQETPADEAAAQLVADSLSGTVVLDLGPTTDGADVTVTTGTTFAVDSTAPSPTTTTTAPATKHGTTTTTTAPAASTTGSAAGTPGAATSTGSAAGATSEFTAPSPATQPLAPWDPRACPTGVTGNAGNW